MTLPSGVTKLPRGVELNGKNLRISFMYRGERCREPVLASKLTKATIAYADNKRRAILAEIKEGRFEYTAHFPESPRAASFKLTYSKMVCHRKLLMMFSLLYGECGQMRLVMGSSKPTLSTELPI